MASGHCSERRCDDCCNCCSRACSSWPWPRGAHVLPPHDDARPRPLHDDDDALHSDAAMRIAETVVVVVVVVAVVVVV